jgi:hypothetical protein
MALRGDPRISSADLYRAVACPGASGPWRDLAVHRAGARGSWNFSKKKGEQKCPPSNCGRGPVDRRCMRSTTTGLMIAVLLDSTLSEIELNRWCAKGASRIVSSGLGRVAWWKVVRQVRGEAPPEHLLLSFTALLAVSTLSLSIALHSYATHAPASVCSLQAGDAFGAALWSIYR